MTANPSAADASSPKTQHPKKRKMSQERVMIMFTLFFALGILLLVILPEGHGARGIAMSVYSIVVFWAMFRFGI